MLAPLARSQQATALAVKNSIGPDSSSSVSISRPPVKEAPERELVLESTASYGNYRIFAGGSNCKLYMSGFEYDRHSWGNFLGAEMDYVAEVLPVVILNEPAMTDIWGDTIGPGRKTLPGIGFSPIGLRMVWRPNKAIRPYLLSKGGMLAFTQKALSSQGSYEAFSLNNSFGLLIRATPRYDLRLGLFGDFHFSNAFMVPVNPGLDVMNASIGLSYHLGKRKLQMPQ